MKIANKYFTLLLVLLALPLTAMQKVPVELDFSNAAERAKWQFMYSSDTISTQWVIGESPDYAYGHNYMLYTSNDSSATRTYTPLYPPYYASYRCMAYYQLDTLPKGKYVLEFRYRGIGNSSAYIYPRITSSLNIYSSGSPACYSTDDSGKWWKTGTCTFTSDGSTPYYLCFYFRNDSHSNTSKVNQGYAVDAIQIYPENDAPSCSQKPLSFEMARSGNDVILSWLGNASEYQLEYFLNDTSLNALRTIDNITTTSYVLHPETMQEGTYTFRVRSICGNDTSAWTALDYQLVYDISKHCMDYLNFSDPNVFPQYGYTWSPGYYNGVDDRGFLSEASHHTIHRYPRDFDARTNYKLRTFPQGEPAAIRLGNWRTGAEAETIIYTMEVTPDMSILLLRYALVMQLPGHNKDQQPRFTLEFLDTNGNLMDSCGYVDFTASADLDGWHTEPAKEGETDIIWKDWSLIGLNMRSYIGQTVKIRITTKDCSEGAHFGYAYFTMSCSSGSIEGLHCGIKPDHFTVEEGFYYRWNKKYDPDKTVLGTERTFNLTDPMDSATYCVDMINMLKPECYFTMEASSLAYIPIANGTIQYAPSDCKNYIQLVDSSSTIGVYWDTDGIKKVVRTTPGVDDILWDLGMYGTSTERSPKIPVPDAGDTLHISLHAYLENELCEDVKTFDFVVPAIGTARTIDTYYFCRGGSIEHEGQVYTTEIDFSDTLTAWNGCDSISTVALRFFQPDTVTHYDTICSGHSTEWYGMSLNEGGEYFYAEKSKIYDCDSVHHLLYLYQQPYLNMELGYKQQSICQNGGTIEVPFVVEVGDVIAYDLVFSNGAKQYGYTDRFWEYVVPNANAIAIPMTINLVPGLFEASVVFHNVYCDSLAFPITFVVNYDPDLLITQRWNDFLSVRKTAYDFYGGFYDYQWYKDDQPIAGQTSSQLYLPEGGLEPGSAYSVELTRSRDSVRVRSCPYFPHIEPNTVTISVTPTVVPSQNPAPLHIHSSQPAHADLYSESGAHMASWSVNKGENEIIIPNTRGLYLLYFITESGEQNIRKIIVL